MSNNFSILNSYPKGSSNIRGEFLILNEDPSLCLVFSESEVSDTFISEEITTSSGTLPIYDPCTVWEGDVMSETSLNNFRALAYGGDSFVVLANNANTALKSKSITNTNIEWEERPVPELNRGWRDIGVGSNTSFENIFIGVASSISNIAGNNRAIISIDNGITWQGLSMPKTASWQAIAFGNNNFASISRQGDVAYLSVNPIIDTSFTLGSGLPTLSFPSAWRDVCYGNDRFVAISESSNLVGYSYDGISWSTSTLPQSFPWRSIEFGDGLFIAMGNSGTNHKAVSSTDGISWDYITSYPPIGIASGVIISDLAYSINRKQWVVVHNNGDFNTWKTSFISNDNGKTWQQTTMSSASDWYLVKSGATTTDPSNDIFLAVTDNNGDVGSILTCPIPR